MIKNDYYDRAVADCTAHHASSKTFSGAFLRRHIHQLRELIDVENLKTVLDYGCGKALEYTRPVTGTDKLPETYWGAKVTLFDPCVPQYAARPQGTFDLVIGLQVLCWVPRPALAAVIDDMYAYANKGIYISEQIGNVKKNILRDQGLTAQGSSVEQWHELVRRPGNGKFCVFADSHQSPGYVQVNLTRLQ